MCPEPVTQLVTVRGARSEPALFCKRPGCGRPASTKASTGRPAVFCSPECRKDFHLAARRAQRALEEAIAIAAQYAGERAQGAQDGNDRARAALRMLVRTALEVAAAPPDELRSELRAKLIASCTEAIASL